MKNKYERLTKEEKKEARLRFRKDESNAVLNKRLFRLQIICIIGIIFGIAVMAYSIITHDKWFFVAEYGFMTVFCVALIMFCRSALDKKYNEFLINEMKKEKESDKKEDKKTKKKSK